MYRTGDQWLALSADLGARWEHDDNPLRPHALVTTHMHVSIYFKGKIVTDDVKLCYEATSDITSKLREVCLLEDIDRVVSPNRPLAHLLALNIGNKRGRSCKWAWAEKTGDAKNKKFFFRKKSIFARERILLCDDTLSTGSSLALVGNLLESYGATLLPHYTCIFNRSGKKEILGKKVTALVFDPQPVMTPQECKKFGPCRLGSEAIPPNTPQNWTALTAFYPAYEHEPVS